MDYHLIFDKQFSECWTFYNFRSTKFIFELYPDNEMHQSVIDYVNLFAYDERYVYRYILHDSDVKKDGSPVKPHYHLYLETDKRQMATALCKHIGLSDLKFCMECDSKSNFLRYLIHYDNPEKHLYSMESVVTNIPNYCSLSLWRKPKKHKNDRINKELRGQDGLTECLNIIDNLFYINGVKGVTYRQVTRALTDADLYNHFVGHQGIIYHYYESWKYDR